MSDAAYANLVALCQFTPGPTSSKVGIGIGLSQAGMPGAIAAWIAFTTPSAIAMLLFAAGINNYADSLEVGWLHGLKVAAVAVVAQAVWGMAKNLCPDAQRFSLAVIAAIITIVWPTSLGQLVAIGMGIVAGCAFLRAKQDDKHVTLNIPLSKITGAISLILFFALLAGLPVASALSQNHILALFDSFYRSGSLVFGGGHVVLPLLQTEVVPPGWVSNDTFLAGYGAAQAIPGPLFTFAAYLGAVMGPEPHGWQGALVCILAIFLPAFLLTIGVLPFWDDLRRFKTVRSALAGVNAAVVGVLMAALYNPVWTSAIKAPTDFGLGLTAFALLSFWKMPAWLVVIACAIGGWSLDKLM